MSSPTASRRRIKRIALICLGVVIFLLISGLLARWLSAENVERDQDLELVQAEARGDAGAMIEKVSGCRVSVSCRASMRRLAANPRLRRSGDVKILNIESPTANSLAGATGVTRFAWTVLGKLPVVQCIKVRRTGNFLAGIDVHLLSISAPIQNEADC